MKYFLVTLLVSLNVQANPFTMGCDGFRIIHEIGCYNTIVSAIKLKAMDCTGALQNNRCKVVKKQCAKVAKKWVLDNVPTCGDK